MRPTRTLMGAKARKAIHQGVNAIVAPVAVTFGPEGHNALLYRTMNRGNRITNDGVTVAECQEPKDIFVRMAAQTFKEACKRTAERVGDGTTGTVILGGKLFNEVYKLLDRNYSTIGDAGSKIGIVSLKKKILESATKVKEAILNSAKKVESLEELEHIAIVSVEDEELGKIIAKMAHETGVDGFIDVVEGYKGEIETEVIKGMRFPAKVAAKGFVNNPKKYEMIGTDCAILMTDFALENEAQVITCLNAINVDKNPKIAILAPSFSSAVLEQLYKASYTIANGANGQVFVQKGKYELLPVLVPSLRTEQFEDLAVYFGARFISKQKGDNLASITDKDLGFVEKIIIKDSEAREDAIATGGAGTYGDGKTAIEQRIETLKDQLKETKPENMKKLMERRIASMASAVGVIRVGDSTQASSLYRKLKIEDAVYACKAALRGGYVKGGGVCLKEIADALEDDNILKSTLLAPYEQIQSSVDGGVTISVDVIDPAESIYYAVEHATQVVANLITVESITAEIEDPAPEEGNFAIAQALTEMVIGEKIKNGQIKAGEEEAYRDSLGGQNEYEFELSNRD